MFAVNVKNLKTLKYNTFSKKHCSFYLFAVSATKEEESIKILKILGFINNIEQYQKNMTEENISQEFRLKEIDKTTNYFTEEKKQNELTSKKHKKVCKILSYTEY